MLMRPAASRITASRPASAATGMPDAEALAEHGQVRRHAVALLGAAERHPEAR